MLSLAFCCLQTAFLHYFIFHSYYLCERESECECGVCLSVWLCGCVTVYLCIYVGVSAEVREDIGSPGIGVTGGFSHMYGRAFRNTLWSMEEQQAL